MTCDTAHMSTYVSISALLTTVLLLLLTSGTDSFRAISARAGSDRVAGLADRPRNIHNILHMSDSNGGSGGMSAAIKMIKKTKLKEVEKLHELMGTSSDHPATRFLQDGSRPEGVDPAINFYESSKSTTNTVTVMSEFNRKAKTGFIIGMPPPEIMSGVLREAGSKSIVISLDKRNGGASTDDFTRFCVEQSRASSFTPGPISIVWHDFIVDSAQVALAAALGAAAVTLFPEMLDNSPEQLKNMVDYCKMVKVEPIVMIKSAADHALGTAAGARVFCTHTLDEAATLALRAQLPESNEQLFGAKLLPESDFSMYAEIDSAWTLRDSGFSFVWPSPEAIYTTGLLDVYGIVFAMKSKASRAFLSPRQFLMDRKKEGAKEYLGDILY